MEDIWEETRKEPPQAHCDFCSCSWQTDEHSDPTELPQSPTTESDLPQTNWIQADFSLPLPSSIDSPMTNSPDLEL